MSSPIGVGREEADHAAGPDPRSSIRLSSIRCASSYSLRAVSPVGRVVQDVGEPALHLPRVEERLPVDVVAQLRQVVVVEARGCPAGQAAAPPSRTSRSAVGSRAPPSGRPSAGRGVGRDGCARSRSRRSPPRAGSARCVGLEQRRGHRDRTRGVLDPHHRAVVLGSTFTAVCARLVVAPPTSRGMDSSCRCISDATLTISSSDGVIRPDSPIRSASTLTSGVEDLLRRHHHPEVDDLVVVALQDDADDVLPDVVDIALDRGHDDRAGVSCWVPAPGRRASPASMKGIS